MDGTDEQNTTQMDGSISPEDVMFTAGDLQHWRWGRGRGPRINPPGAAIFCLQPGLLRRSRKRFRLTEVNGLFGDFWLLNRHPAPLALAGGFGLGAPAMGIAVEEYAAFGVRRFVSIGIAGALQPHLNTGDVVVCAGAVRGEGTSNHYLPPSRLVGADPWLSQGMSSMLEGKGIPCSTGLTWTTDAPYRETRRQVDAYRDEGILTVEMEAAALFSVAKRLGAQAAAVFIVADRLLPQGWQPPAQTAIIEKNSDFVLQALAAWLPSLEEPPGEAN